LISPVVSAVENPSGYPGEYFVTRLCFDLVSLFGENTSPSEQGFTMLGLTDYITEQSWEDTLTAIYVLVADRLDQAARTARFARRRGPAPDHDDAQIITIALATDCRARSRERSWG
jgi:hypothetical protein